MDAKLSAEVEAAALNQTELALRELVQAAVNCGLSKGSLAMMLKSVAAEMIEEGSVLQ